jgi:hypothetical protein
VYDESRSNVAEQRGDDTMSPYSWDKWQADESDRSDEPSDNQN